MDDIKISVIVPTYNREATVQTALESVLAQTFKPYEIIIVDDGSTDQTDKIVKSIESPIIKYIYQENRGAAPARNTGISNARGNWIAFLDSDDIWKEEKLEKQVGLLFIYPNMDFIHTNRTHCLPDGHEDNGRVGAGWSELTDKKYLLHHWALKLSTVMIKTSLLKSIGGYFETDLKICQDYELLWRAVIASSGIGYIESPVVKILLTDDGLSRESLYSKNIYENILAMESVIRWMNTKSFCDAEYSKILINRQAGELKQLIKQRYYNRDILELIKDFIFYAKTTSIGKTALAIMSVLKSMDFRKKLLEL